MRALVVVTRYLGDVLLATPLARSLAAAGYEVEWLVAPGTEAMVADQPFACACHTLIPSWQGLRRSVRSLRGRFDLACVLTGSDRATAVARLVARQVCALLPGRWQDGWKRRLVTRWSGYSPHSHMVSYCADLCRLAGVTPLTHAPALDWNNDDLAAVRDRLGWPEQQPYAQLHPFARWSYKLWPVAQWRRLMGRLHDAGLKIVITAGPDEQGAAEALVRESGLPRDAVSIAAGRFRWRQLAALSANAALYVGLDTATTHLAAGCGAPTVALYGPTDPRIWGPWPAGWNHGRSPWRPAAGGVQRAGNVTLIQGEAGCLPCQKEGCGHHRASRSDCLDRLSTDRVWRQCARRLA